jgi:hypothetical protein
VSPSGVVSIPSALPVDDYTFDVRAAACGGSTTKDFNGLKVTVSAVADPCAGIPAWQPNTSYVGGNKVVYNGQWFSAAWYVDASTTPPANGGAGGAWKLEGACSGGGGTDPGGSGCGGSNVVSDPWGGETGVTCASSIPTWNQGSSYSTNDRVKYVCEGTTYIYKAKGWIGNSATTPNNDATNWTCSGTCP